MRQQSESLAEGTAQSECIRQWMRLHSPAVILPALRSRDMEENNAK